MKRTRLLNIVAATLLSAALFVESSSAQVLFSAGSPCTQSFDGLASSGTANTWTDNSTLPGWYASKTLGGATVSIYRASIGSENNGALYSFGSTDSSERALGSIASGTPGNFAYGIRFQNDTALAITNITISYTGEQWRNGGNASMATQTLVFSYFISNDPITSSDAAGANAWVPFTSLDFNSPTVGATATALDGNDSVNRQTFSGVLLPNVVVFPGQEIFFRWYDINDAGNDHGLAIDDLSIAFTSITPVVIPPAIDPSGQPQSRTNNAGTRATFTVTATGSAPTYRWQLNETDLINGVKVSGATTATLSISNVLAIDAGSYRVIVANSQGSVTSSVAVLTVLDPAVNTQPVSRTNLAGDNANFFVRAAGTIPLSYQWRFNGTDIADGTLSSLNVGPLQATNQGSYSVVVGNVDLNYTTSAVATLTLQATPASMLARWDFDATNTLDVAAPAPSTGSGTAALLNGVAGAWASGTYSDPAGAPGAANSGWNTDQYPPQGTSNRTAGVQFNVSTLGFHNVLLAWEQRHSDTASKYTRLQYSTDGQDFVDGDVYTMLNTRNDFVFNTSDLSGILGVNNNPNFAFRIVTEWEATAIGNTNPNYAATVSSYSTGGTIRFDLVSAYGDPGVGPVLAPTTITNISGSTLSYSGGAGSQFVLLESADVTAAMSSWTRVKTNTSTPGTFDIPQVGTSSPKYYRIKSQ
jgi:hypothetical protein